MTETLPHRRARLFFSEAQKEINSEYLESLPNDGGLPCGPYLGSHLLYDLDSSRLIEYTNFAWIDTPSSLSHQNWPLTDKGLLGLSANAASWDKKFEVGVVRENKILPILFSRNPAHLPLSAVALLGRWNTLEALYYTKQNLKERHLHPTFYKTNSARALTLSEALREKLPSFLEGKPASVLFGISRKMRHILAAA